LNNRKFQKAFDAFTKAIKKNPNHAGAHYSRGDSLILLKKVNKALIEFEKAIEINPKVADYYAGKGVTLYLLNEHESAIQNLHKALKIEPNKHWHVLAQIHISNKNFEEASKCIDKALIAEPNKEFYQKLKLLIKSGLKYGKNFHIPIERSLLLFDIPLNDEIIYSTWLHIRTPNKNINSVAIITKNGISTVFPYSGMHYVRWENIKFTSGNKFKISGFSCSLHWKSDYESNKKFKERKKIFKEDIINLRNN